MKIHELIWPEDRIDHIAGHGVEPEEVEDVCFGAAARRMGSTLSNTDSVEELARFWDEHDVTEFDDELEEVTSPMFERKTRPEGNDAYP